MSTTDFMGADRPCIQCAHFGGWRAANQGAAWCLDGKIVHARPEHGCAFWTQKEKSPPTHEGRREGSVQPDQETTRGQGVSES